MNISRNHVQFPRFAKKQQFLALGDANSQKSCRKINSEQYIHLV